MQSKQFKTNMDETIIFPSPNWFQVSGLAVSKDGWLVYGGPTKSLCVLKPLDPTSDGIFQRNQSFQAHFISKAHKEKIVSVDLSRDWPERKLILTGSADGAVKQWNVDILDNNGKIKSTHHHVIHQSEKEEVIGVEYSSEPFAVTVGCFGNIVKWDLNSNIAKNYNSFLKNFRPNCIACSHHIPLNVAIGTKQGVIFVLDLNHQGKIVYKIRGQDDEIVNVSWCPQYKIILRKSFNESHKKTLAIERLEKVKSNVEDSDLNNSAIAKNLPEDSFDESIVQEDDMFDIYKDHEADEFGHKKFQPKDIIVKVKEEKDNNDFLAECLKLKEDILKKKNEPEPTIANLVDALDKTHVDSDNSDEQEDSNESPTNEEKEIRSKELGDSSIHTHRHLLATIGKCGGVRIWSKTGKLVGSCVVPNSQNKCQKNKRPSPNSNSLLWYKPDVLLIADGKSQLLECNPLKIDCKNKLEWSIVHSLHKRGLYGIATNAPRVQSPDQSNDKSSDQSSDQSTVNWKVWTVAQDRNIVCYSVEKRKKIAIYNTCGGFIYTMQHCPYDAKRLALSVGDGTVRVWESDISDEDPNKLAMGSVMSFWQNVQGKVLTVSWHPTRENLLAFATAESRIGIIDASKSERPAKTLTPSLRGGIYTLCWGHKFQLYACGGGDIVVYDTSKPEQAPVTINVEFEGKKWDLSSVVWYPRGLMCGSNNGAIAVLNTVTNELVTASFVFNKMIHNIEWHPQQTSDSSEESKYKDLIAVSALDRQSVIVILEYADKGDGPKLHPWKTLNGHVEPVCQMSWNPHKDGLLVSTSYDSTVRVWDVSEAKCIAIFDGHFQATFSASWSPFPQLSSTIMSGGADCCLRLWKYEDYPADAYSENKTEVVSKKEKKKKEKKEDNKAEENKTQELNVSKTATDGQVATKVDVNAKIKVPKRFLLPTIQRQISPCSIQSVRKMSQKYIHPEKVQSNGKESPVEPKEKIDDLNEVEEDKSEQIDFLKMFGNTNDINELLDLEMKNHIENERYESSIMLSIFRGHIDSMIQFASQKDALCPFLVSLTPCVSFKFWKTVTQLYLAQIERLVAKAEQRKIWECRHYGGHIYRKVALLLSVHDVKAAVTALTDAKLYKEAYILSKSRHMDSIAEETLKTWAIEMMFTGCTNMATICYLALGDVYNAAISLAKSNDQECLSLAAELAKVAGQPTFANHIEDKRTQIRSETPQNETEDLKPLPSKVDVLLKDFEMAKESDETNDE